MINCIELLNTEDNQEIINNLVNSIEENRFNELSQNEDWKTLLNDIVAQEQFNSIKAIIRPDITEETNKLKISETLDDMFTLSGFTGISTIPVNELFEIMFPTTSFELKEVGDTISKLVDIAEVEIDTAIEEKIDVEEVVEVIEPTINNNLLSIINTGSNRRVEELEDLNKKINELNKQNSEIVRANLLLEYFTFTVPVQNEDTTVTTFTMPVSELLEMFTDFIKSQIESKLFNAYFNTKELTIDQINNYLENDYSRLIYRIIQDVTNTTFNTLSIATKFDEIIQNKDSANFYQFITDKLLSTETNFQEQAMEYRQAYFSYVLLNNLDYANAFLGIPVNITNISNRQLIDNDGNRLIDAEQEYDTQYLKLKAAYTILKALKSFNGTEALKIITENKEELNKRVLEKDPIVRNIESKLIFKNKTFNLLSVNNIADVETSSIMFDFIQTKSSQNFTDSETRDVLNNISDRVTLFIENTGVYSIDYTARNKENNLYINKAQNILNADFFDESKSAVTKSTIGNNTVYLTQWSTITALGDTKNKSSKTPTFVDFSNYLKENALSVDELNTNVLSDSSKIMLSIYLKFYAEEPIKKIDSTYYYSPYYMKTEIIKTLNSLLQQEQTSEISDKIEQLKTNLQAVEALLTSLTSTLLSIRPNTYALQENYNLKNWGFGTSNITQVKLVEALKTRGLFTTTHKDEIEYTLLNSVIERFNEFQDSYPTITLPSMWKNGKSTIYQFRNNEIYEVGAKGEFTKLDNLTDTKINYLAGVVLKSFGLPYFKGAAKLLFNKNIDLKTKYENNIDKALLFVNSFVTPFYQELRKHISNNKRINQITSQDLEIVKNNLSNIIDKRVNFNDVKGRDQALLIDTYIEILSNESSPTRRPIYKLSKNKMLAAAGLPNMGYFLRDIVNRTKLRLEKIKYNKSIEYDENTNLPKSVYGIVHSLSTNNKIVTGDYETKVEDMVVKSDVTVPDASGESVTKSISQLSLKESIFNNIEILFFDSLLNSVYKSSNVKTITQKVYIQASVYADKSSQYAYGYTFKDKRNLLSDEAMTLAKKEFIENNTTYHKNLVKQIITSYMKIFSVALESNVVSANSNPELYNVIVSWVNGSIDSNLSEFINSDQDSLYEFMISNFRNSTSELKDIYRLFNLLNKNITESKKALTQFNNVIASGLQYNNNEPVIALPDTAFVIKKNNKKEPISIGLKESLAKGLYLFTVLDDSVKEEYLNLQLEAFREDIAKSGYKLSKDSKSVFNRYLNALEKGIIEMPTKIDGMSLEPHTLFSLTQGNPNDTESTTIPFIISPTEKLKLSLEIAKDLASQDAVNPINRIYQLFVEKQKTNTTLQNLKLTKTDIEEAILSEGYSAIENLASEAMDLLEKHLYNIYAINSTNIANEQERILMGSPYSFKSSGSISTMAELRNSMQTISVNSVNYLQPTIDKIKRNVAQSSTGVLGVYAKEGEVSLLAPEEYKIAIIEDPSITNKLLGSEELQEQKVFDGGIFIGPLSMERLRQSFGNQLGQFYITGNVKNFHPNTTVEGNMALMKEAMYNMFTMDLLREGSDTLRRVFIKMYILPFYNEKEGLNKQDQAQNVLELFVVELMNRYNNSKLSNKQTIRSLPNKPTLYYDSIDYETAYSNTVNYWLEFFKLNSFLFNTEFENVWDAVNKQLSVFPEHRNKIIDRIAFPSSIKVQGYLTHSNSKASLTNNKPLKFQTNSSIYDVIQLSKDHNPDVTGEDMFGEIAAHVSVATQTISAASFNGIVQIYADRLQEGLANIAQLKYSQYETSSLGEYRKRALLTSVDRLLSTLKESDLIDTFQSALLETTGIEYNSDTMLLASANLPIEFTAAGNTSETIMPTFSILQKTLEEYKQAISNGLADFFIQNVTNYQTDLDSLNDIKNIVLALSDTNNSYVEKLTLREMVKDSLYTIASSRNDFGLLQAIKNKDYKANIDIGNLTNSFIANIASKFNSLMTRFKLSGVNMVASPSAFLLQLYPLTINNTTEWVTRSVYESKLQNNLETYKVLNPDKTITNITYFSTKDRANLKNRLWHVINKKIYETPSTQEILKSALSKYGDLYVYLGSSDNQIYLIKTVEDILKYKIEFDTVVNSNREVYYNPVNPKEMDYTNYYNRTTDISIYENINLNTIYNTEKQISNAQKETKLLEKLDTIALNNNYYIIESTTIPKENTSDLISTLNLAINRQYNYIPIVKISKDSEEDYYNVDIEYNVENETQKIPFVDTSLTSVLQNTLGIKKIPIRNNYGTDTPYQIILNNGQIGKGITYRLKASENEDIDTPFNKILYYLKYNNLTNSQALLESFSNKKLTINLIDLFKVVLTDSYINKTATVDSLPVLQNTYKNKLEEISNNLLLAKDKAKIELSKELEKKTIVFNDFNAAKYYWIANFNKEQINTLANSESLINSLQEYNNLISSIDNQIINILSDPYYSKLKTFISTIYNNEVSRNALIALANINRRKEIVNGQAQNVLNITTVDVFKSLMNYLQTVEQSSSEQQVSMLQQLNNAIPEINAFIDYLYATTPTEIIAPRIQKAVYQLDNVKQPTDYLSEKGLKHFQKLAVNYKGFPKQLEKIFKQELSDSEYTSYLIEYCQTQLNKLHNKLKGNFPNKTIIEIYETINNTTNFTVQTKILEDSINQFKEYVEITNSLIGLYNTINLDNQKTKSYKLYQKENIVVNTKPINIEDVKNIVLQHKLKVGEYALSLQKSYEKSLELIGNRIPGTGKQSYYWAKIKGYIDSHRNALFGSQKIMTVSGNDLDIDMGTLISYSIDNRFNSSTRGLVYDYSFAVDEQGNLKKDEQGNIIKYVDENGIVDEDYTIEALKNYLLDNLKASISSPEVAIESQVPVGISTLQGLVEKYENSDVIVKYNPNNPFNPFYIMYMERVNMIGKSGIGVFASTAMKAFSAIYNTYNKILTDKENNQDKLDSVKLNVEFLKVNPVTGEVEKTEIIDSVANINTPLEYNKKELNKLNAELELLQEGRIKGITELNNIGFNVQTVQSILTDTNKALLSISQLQNVEGNEIQISKLTNFITKLQTIDTGIKYLEAKKQIFENNKGHYLQLRADNAASELVNAATDF